MRWQNRRLSDNVEGLAVVEEVCVAIGIGGGIGGVIIVVSGPVI